MGTIGLGQECNAMLVNVMLVKTTYILDTRTICGSNGHHQSIYDLHLH